MTEHSVINFKLPVTKMNLVCFFFVCDGFFFMAVVVFRVFSLEIDRS